MEDDFILILIDKPDKQRIQDEAEKKKVDLMYYCKTKLLQGIKEKI
jgi:hypothetical protein